MDQLLRRFDTWAAAGSFRLKDLAIFRIAYALGILFVLPPVTAIAGRPDSFLAPPPGPFQLVHAVPSESMLLVLQVLLMLAAASLCIGWFTTASSWAVCLLVVTTFGLDYSFDRIDHTILLVVTPAVMSFSRWGGALSLDALAPPRGGAIRLSGPYVCSQRASAPSFFSRLPSRRFKRAGSIPAPVPSKDSFFELAASRRAR